MNTKTERLFIVQVTGIESFPSGRYRVHFTDRDTIDFYRWFASQDDAAAYRIGDTYTLKLQEGENLPF